ncbi:MAG: electron transfer flavoprotein subunit beta/FixA family protein [Chloroflexi bacterium]|nr:electron transfer flavoprotein subunit beta/FixA family protein [Chloroflexota bacterium]
MLIVSFTRSTPDTAAALTVGADGKVNWGGAGTVVNPWDEYALEEAIVQAKNAGGKATVIAIGGEMHADALKHSLAMGLDEAIRIEDPAVDPTDGLAYGITAAAAVRKLGETRLVIFGKEAVDVGSDQHTAVTARKLGWNLLTGVAKILAVDFAAGTIKVERALEGGKQVVTSSLPAVISVTKEINEPRYPSFIGIRKASKAVIPVWSLADLGVALSARATETVAIRGLPARSVQVEMIEGEPAQQAAILVDKLLAEKVL